MTALVTRRDVEDMLLAWRSDTVSHRQVHDWAEARHMSDAWDVENDAVSVVLGALDMLDLNLTTPSEIPAMLSALEAPDEESASLLLDRHWAAVDLEARRQLLAKDPFYAPFWR